MSHRPYDLRRIESVRRQTNKLETLFQMRRFATVILSVCMYEKGLLTRRLTPPDCDGINHDFTLHAATAVIR